MPSTRHLALPLIALGLTLATLPAGAQSSFPTSRAPVGGATGARAGTDWGANWSTGEAPNTDFDRQGNPVARGAPLSRTEQIRRRSAAALAGQRQEALATPPPGHRTQR